ncbi:MAG: glycosyltransferase family 2 protein [Oscillospiraceae bacterium]|nr:glycosyltransferase family 2 protein [Oscillospiraceae bacterium]
MDNPFLSIITPTYNRGHLLNNCYESLCRQTDKDFQWIIVDDGSKDDTRNVVATFDTDDFEIIYVPKENGGKHTALNAAHPYIRGKYVLILDSDDYLTDTAVEQTRRGWEVWADEGQVAIVTFLKGAAVDDPNCTGPVAGTPVDILRYRRNAIHSTDCCEVIRAELFLQYPFPVFPGERFVAECALWNRVAKTHKCVYINEVIYICEYLEGGLTDSGRAMRIRNPRGGMFISDLRMGKNNYLTQRLKYGLLYCCYGFFADLTPGQILAGTENKSIAALCMMPGCTMHRLWKNKYLYSKEK